MKDKKNSSLGLGLQLLSKGEGDAFVSCGNTGALFSGSSLIVKRLPGIQRAGLGAIVPTTRPFILMDSGASVKPNEEYMRGFALMGSAYMKAIYGVEEPKVGLINNGAEEHKGTELQQAVYALLKNDSNLNFVGNVEGTALPMGACDVAVADGFTGNIVLKTIEGMGKLMLRTMKDIFFTDLKAKLSALLIKKKLNEVKAVFDPNEYGGAPILGIAKPVIKAHGSSNAKAVKNAIRQAIAYAESGVIYSIARETKLFAPSPAAKSEEEKPASANLIEK